MKKLKLLVILAIIFIIGQIDISYAFEFDDKIYKNVYVQDINLSGLTKKEAEQKINSYLQNRRYFELIYRGQNIAVDKLSFDADYMVCDLVDRAYNVGRDEDIISNIKTRISLRKGNKKVISLKCKYDDSKIDEFISKLNEKIYIHPVDAAAKIIDGSVAVTDEKYGQTIDKNKLREIIIYKLKNCDCSEDILPVKVINPKYTANQLKKIDTVLGSYETVFNPKNINRVNNIAVASESTSNVLLGIGERFSFNSFLSSNDVRVQLKEAPIIKNGKSDKGVGGGICQVSTTIYNAALYAGMKIVSVTNHSIPSTYAEKGRDATVSSGYIDFVFENDNKTPIIIYNQVFEDKILSKIYGSVEDKKDIEIETEILKTINNKTILKKDSNLDKGSKVVEQKGRLGYTVNTFRLYKLQDKILKKEYISTSYYPPCDEIVLIGTKNKSINK